MAPDDDPASSPPLPPTYAAEEVHAPTRDELEDESLSQIQVEVEEEPMLSSAQSSDFQDGYPDQGQEADQAPPHSQKGFQEESNPQQEPEGETLMEGTQEKSDARKQRRIKRGMG